MARKKKVQLVIDYTDAKDQSSSPLFIKLPAELRLRIYKFVVKDTDLVWRRRSKKDRSSGYIEFLRNGKPHGPDMVLACKQIHQEMIPILYKQGRFLFNTLTAFRNWLKVVDGDDLKLVQCVVIGYAPDFRRYEPYDENKMPGGMLHEESGWVWIRKVKKKRVSGKKSE